MREAILTTATLLTLIACLVTSIMFPENFTPVAYMVPVLLGLILALPQFISGLAVVFAVHGLQGVVVLLVMIIGLLALVGVVADTPQKDRGPLLMNIFTGSIAFGTGVGFEKVKANFSGTQRNRGERE